MGEARQRGSRDERVAQAVAAGRIKEPRKHAAATHHSLTMTAVGMSLLARARQRIQRARKR